MKRLVETQRWRDNWFLELNPYSKLLLSFLYDNCDEAGFSDANMKVWAEQLKIQISEIKDSLIELKDALLSDGKKKLFIKDFLKHQKKLPLNTGTEENDWIILKLKNNLEKFNNAKEIQNIIDTVVDSSKIEKTEIINSKKKEVKRFQIPTEEEFHSLYQEIYAKIKPDAKEPAIASDISNLLDYYLSNGWKNSNKSPIQDLEACIRKAIRRGDTFRKTNNYNNGQAENKKSRTESTLSAVDRIIQKNNAR